MPNPGLGGGSAGDLYLEIEFRPHRFYQAQGHDIYIHVPVTPWEAALGGKIEVPTPAGIVDLKIPEESATGRKLRLKGRGIPGKPPGDLDVVLEVALPPATTEEAKAFYRHRTENTIMRTAQL